MVDDKSFVSHDTVEPSDRQPLLFGAASKAVILGARPMRDDQPTWLAPLGEFVAASARHEEVSTVCSLLMNRRRQLVILYMLTRDQNEWTTMSDVARWVTAVTKGYSIEGATGDDYRNIRESLRNTHLSALADAGVIEYDSQQTRVAPGEQLDDVAGVFFHLLLLTGS